MRSTLKSLGVMLLVAFAFAEPAQAGQVTIATGYTGGGYHTIGKSIASTLTSGKPRVSASVMETTGSVENIELFNEGEAGIAIIQADAAAVYPISRQYRALTSHTEYAMWVHNSKYGFSDLSNMEKEQDYAVAIVTGSGAAVTWNSFKKADSGYAETKVVEFDSLYDAAFAVSEGLEGKTRIAGLIYVGRTFPMELQLDFPNLVMGEMTDGDFDAAEDANGEKLYTSCKVPESAYSNLSSSNNWFKPSTVCLDAKVLIARTDNKRADRTIQKAVIRSLR